MLQSLLFDLNREDTLMQPRVPYELTEQERCSVKFTSGRVNLMAMILISLANIAFFVFGQTYLVPFSASIPYYAVVYSYVGGYLPSSVGWAIALGYLGISVICWVRAKEDWRWLLGGFVLFTLDCVAFSWILSNGMAVSFWPDIVFHLWMLYYLSTGVRYGRKLEKTPGSALAKDIDEELL